MRYRTTKYLAAIVASCFLFVCVISVMFISSQQDHDPLSSINEQPGELRRGKEEGRMTKAHIPSHTATHDANSSSSLPDYRVHVFYYPWYGNPVVDGRYLHWNHRYLPDWHRSAKVWPTGRHEPPHDIGSRFYPRLGPYSSRDPAVVSDHMRQIRESGAGVVVVSWYPPGLADDEGFSVDQVTSLILDTALLHSLKVCIHIEPYKNRTVDTLNHDLTYINATYSTHPAYYQHISPDGRPLPLFYVYDSYQIAVLQWRRLLHPEGDLTVRGSPLDALFIGLLVDAGHLNDLATAGFNGLYTYFSSEGFSYGSTWRNWVRLSSLASNRGLMFIPCVGPGYDDTAIRPWNAANTRDRQHGEYYRRGFSTAIKSRPHVIGITSFNEWGEGSQIEEAVPHAVNQNGTRAGFIYEDYEPHGPDWYLTLTKIGCKQFQRARNL